MAEKNKVLVVGASRGLGLALAEEYCTRGWQVIATTRGSSRLSLKIETVDIVHLDSVRALKNRLIRHV